ncbi:MAG: alginate lyase family protein [Acidobacteria bacterium]|nr:alginate lyase family protein [Acidobacteriota bacterium]
MIWQKLRGMTLKELSAEVFLRLRRQASQTYHRAVDDIGKSFLSDDELALALNSASVAQVASQIRAGQMPPLTFGLGDLAKTAAFIAQHLPDTIEQTRREADDILKHRLLIFNRALDFGEVINWHCDIETGTRWPLLHHTLMPIAPGKRADVRAVWELNRLHHLVTLGRAYALTGDERYTTEFIAQLTSWCDLNPPRFGINWTVAMEVGIRAVNLVAALNLFRASPLLTDVVMAVGLKTLLSHGRFIRANLEFSHRVASNHYLSDLIGLFAIGSTFPCFKESKSWVKFSAKELLKQFDKQVLEDGVDFEASIAYHRLVTEIFLLFFTLGKANDVALPDASWRKFQAMFAFVRAYLKPDQTAPLLGDCDDGRLLKFTERRSVDHAYLLSIAAVLFDEENFKPTNHIDAEALWWFGADGVKKFEELPVTDHAPTSQAFNEAQIFIQRKASLYAIMDCGDHGANGRGSHAHADALSFELFAYGQTFLRDPGTYVYTASKRWRHLFRSTAYHNTVRIDRQEISELNQDQPFALGTNVLPKINAWESTAQRDVLDAEHYGYRRLAEPVTHRRKITFEKRYGYWLFEDMFTGVGEHLFEFFFNCDAGLQVELQENQVVRIKGESAALMIVPVINISNHPGHLANEGTGDHRGSPLDVGATTEGRPYKLSKIDQSLNNETNQPTQDSPFAQWNYEILKSCRWVSPSYRTRLRSSGIIYRLRKRVPFMSAFALIPFRFDDRKRAQEIISRFAFRKT